MNAIEIKEKLLSGGFDERLALLYGDAKAAAKRYATACDEFVELYGVQNDVRLFSAPGRTEIGGNHTDHQHGRVLAGSVDLDVIAVVSPNAENIIRVKSAGYEMDVLKADELDVIPADNGRSSALIRGVCAAVKNNGGEVGGFNAYTTSNVLKGSGLSSSAAFEVLIANILNGMFNNNSIDAVTIAKYSQYAENVHFGKPSGLLDQMASSVGGFTYADFNDPANPVIEKIELDLHKFGYTLCVVDTGGNHADLTQDYADITIECRMISNALGVDFLRDADESKFYARLGELRKTCNDRAILRALHFFNEDKRAEEQREALKAGEFEKFLAMVNASGDSSYKCLQNLYSPANPAEQGLALAVSLTKQYLGDKGACRVHGGGFAGTIQCYIPNDMFSEYREMIESVFGKGSCVPISIRPLGGCEII